MSRISSQLTPITFHIIFVLSKQEMHGYEIIKQVTADTNGKINLLTGTLYNSLNRLLEKKLINETKHDSRRRYYRTTEIGKKLIETELERYQQALLIAKLQLSPNNG